MPIVKFFYILLAALFVSLILIPPITRLAVNFGKLDLPDDRKIHTGKIPRLAGVAIFLAVLFPIILFCNMDRTVRGFLAGGFIIFATGLYDDLSGLRPRWKLAGEIVAALMAVLVGNIAINDLGNLFGSGDIQLGMLAVPFTIIGIVGVTNAVNLMDGLDGLAGGISAIAAVAFGLLAYSVGNQQLLCLTVALFGAILGFLKFNTYPARIFMGDSGSLFLGYSLAVFAVILCSQSSMQISEMVPLIILVVPIVDTLIVMVNRLRSGHSLFAPDNGHIHHRLLGVGFGHKATVIILYVLSYLMAIVGVGTARLAGYEQLLILVPVVLFLMLLHRCIGPELFVRLPMLLSNESIRQSPGFRHLLRLSGKVISLVKYLAVLVLMLSVFLPNAIMDSVGIVSALLLVLSVTLMLMTRDLGNRFLHVVIYADGAFIVFLVENFGRGTLLAGQTLNMISNGLFLLLFICCGVKLYIDRRSRDLMQSPLEYLLFFMVISVPFFPLEFTSHYHLLTVMAKLVILFASYRMLLVQKIVRNRRIIAATLLALLVVAVKGLLPVFL